MVVSSTLVISTNQTDRHNIANILNMVVSSTLVISTNQTDRHNITNILNIHNPTTNTNIVPDNYVVYSLKLPRMSSFV